MQFDNWSNIFLWILCVCQIYILHGWGIWSPFYIGTTDINIGTINDLNNRDLDNRYIVKSNQKEEVTKLTLVEKWTKIQTNRITYQSEVRTAISKPMKQLITGLFWVGKCVYAQNVEFPQQYVVGLPTKYLPAIRELAWNRLTHYFGLVLLIFRLREPSSLGIPPTRGKEFQSGPSTGRTQSSSWG